MDENLRYYPEACYWNRIKKVMELSLIYCMVLANPILASPFPSDTIKLAARIYSLKDVDKDVIHPKSGTASHWTVIRGIKGKTKLVGYNGLPMAIDLSNKSYILIEDIEITGNEGGAMTDGIQALTGPCHHILLKNLDIHHIDGMAVNMGDVNEMGVENCRFSYCGYGAIGGPDPQQGGWQHILIKNSKLLYSGSAYPGKKESDYDRPDGFGIEASQGPIEIIGCEVAFNQGDGIDSKAANTSIRSCKVYNNRCDGVKLWVGNSLIENCLIYGRGFNDRELGPYSAIVIDAAATGNFDIQNCTVDDELGNNYILYAQYDNPAAITLNMRNTIFSSRGPRGGIFLGKNVDCSFKNNLFYFPETEDALNYKDQYFSFANLKNIGSGSIVADPQFIDFKSYHLKPTSPAIDKGTNPASSGDPFPPFDLDGNNRPKGNGIDIGCFEDY